jgi:hypothetical protein
MSVAGAHHDEDAKGQPQRRQNKTCDYQPICLGIHAGLAPGSVAAAVYSEINIRLRLL